MNNRRFAIFVIIILPAFALAAFSSVLGVLDREGGLGDAVPTGIEQEIILRKTVALDLSSCGLQKELELPAGTEVIYCYEVTNNGTITLTQHELVDSELGTLFDGPAELVPGDTMSVTAAVAISNTIVNSATWTAYKPGPTDTITSSDTATVTIVSAALIEVDPLSISSVQGPGEQDTFPLNIRNVGDSVLNWSLHEEEEVLDSQSKPGTLEAGWTSTFDRSPKVIQSVEECSPYQPYAGAEPLGYAEFCLPGLSLKPRAMSSSSLGPTDIAYAQDIGFISDNFVRHELNNFPGQVVVGQQAAPIFGYDFDVTGRILYGLNNDTLQLGTIDLSNGSFSPIGSSIPITEEETLTGLTTHPSTGEAYASTTDGITGRIYHINLSTGAMALIGGDESIPFLIDIAMNPDGILYGLDISTDSLYTIDTGTGLATLVGPIGVDANFSQGMDFDNEDGTLYAWIYEGGGLNQYGILDLGTGALTTLAIDNPTGEFEGATQTPVVDSCRLEEQIPWMSTSQAIGTVGPGASQSISVTLDSTSLTSGFHEGIICIESNDFFGRVVRVPITLEVESVAGIILNKSVGLEPNECASTEAISVPAGTRVYYCYEVTNMGSVPFSRHILVDSELDYPILNDLSAPLLPGNSLRPIVGAVLFDTTINTATWTAYNPGPSDTVSDSNTALVIVTTSILYTPLILKP
jgi:hypothetical protein